MFRLRRYRYFVLFATIVVFLLYRVVQNSDQWEAVSASFPKVVAPSKFDFPPTSDSNVGDKGGSSQGMSAEDPDLPQRILENTGKNNPAGTVPDLTPPNRDPVTDQHDDTDVSHDPTLKDVDVKAYDHDEASKSTTATGIGLPDPKVAAWAADTYEAQGNALTTETHWKKVRENFPVPKDDVIPLPAGKPKKIPTIQYAFEKESLDIREVREARQSLVKAEMERSWAGYWQYARGHDELRPVTKKFRDPFCGWAATLVDSLDTLWIMGMEDEFKEALEEVERIDFTISQRSQIPVFETTIRYLGGLIAAYDVSGGPNGGFDVLLRKAVELAEILMGVFDTPNRMPVLYYDWKPQSASKPKRASTGVSVAELGSLAMEFTRLAQITKENKYYDAVARITDAFYEWQERGTSIPGIFPEHVDASGCNRTAQAALEAAQSKAESETNDANRRTKAVLDGDDELDLEMGDKTLHGGFDKAVSRIARRAGKGSSLNFDIPKRKNPLTGKMELVAAGEGSLPDCVAQGLASRGYGGEEYSMGGSQDSTYEYFPKQWLLLGGLEPKYKELHLRVSEAVKKWLLYRPMVPDNRNILFSGKIFTTGDPETDAVTEYEVTHLTCFLGGMFAMGGKIFEVPADVEIGKKLTDGCVWAYEATETGIMPEGAKVLPCDNVKTCHWNQTRWEQAIDPLYDSRREQLDSYYERKEKAKIAAAKEKERQSLEKETEEESDEDKDEDPYRPLSHEEFVANKMGIEHLPKGFVEITSKSYILRPEAIESVWYMYRITGDRKWQDKGWKMFEAIVRHTSTTVGNSAIDNVLSPDPLQVNEMESFWTAETLKYFYLLYSDPDVISLDQWVLNTEAHPFKRPKSSFAV
ncbi:glycosyl hydrolase family 47-domain-containing protein [Poronia punctata]|nr:glycosyl hydrolase family 47-domain-containing protein [Poronia punctata]